MSETKEASPEPVRATAARILEDINGASIEQTLMDLAQIGRTVEKVGTRVAVSRLAFSEEDRKARAFLNEKMSSAGMAVTEYPFGLALRIVT